MRWLADECVAAEVVACLREAGHDTAYMAEVGAGESDIQVIERARQETRLLLTEDKDFGELVFRRGREVPGVVLLRVDIEEPTHKWFRLRAAIERLGESLFGRYTVIEETRFRSRPLYPSG